MRRAANLDSNHRAIVLALRSIGATVQSLASMGGGVPDLLVGYRGLNVLLEVKDSEKPPSARSLTLDETHWQETWGGQVKTVSTCEEAQRVVIAHCCPVPAAGR
jgi:hypothetical protein